MLNKKNLLLIAALYLLLSLHIRAEVSGTWTAEYSQGKLQLGMQQGKNHQVGMSYELSSLTGLTSQQLNASGRRAVAFDLVREAGSIRFEGEFQGSEGAGHFRFKPAAGFAPRMKALGVRLKGDSSGAMTDRDLYSFAVFDISSALVRELQTLGYRDLSLDQLVALRIHGGSPGFIREMGAAGYKNLTLDEVVAMRIHGVTTAFVREIASEGFRPDADGLVAMRIHGASPEFVTGLRRLGYTLTDVDEVVAMCIHGVTTEFVEGVKALGYSPTADELIAMRIHGVTAAFIRDVKGAGYEKVSVQKLIEMKIHGLDGAYLRSARKK